MKLEGLLKADTLHREKVARLWNPDYPANIDILMALQDLRADLLREIHAVLKSERELAEAEHNVVAGLNVLLAESGKKFRAGRARRR